MRADPDEGGGFAVTVWVEGVASQEEADAVVEQMLAAITAPGRGTAVVVPE